MIWLHTKAIFVQLIIFVSPGSFCSHRFFPVLHAWERWQQFVEAPVLSGAVWGQRCFFFHYTDVVFCTLMKWWAKENREKKGDGLFCIPWGAEEVHFTPICMRLQLCMGTDERKLFARSCVTDLGKAQSIDIEVQILTSRQRRSSMNETFITRYAFICLFIYILG